LPFVAGDASRPSSGVLLLPSCCPPVTVAKSSAHDLASIGPTTAERISPFLL
jgi:hypothetical protein